MTEETHPLNFRGARILAWTSFALLNVLYVLACMQRTAIPGAIFNDLQGDLGLVGSQVTRLGAIYVYVYACMQIFAGMLVDRFGGKKMGVVGGLLMGAGLLLFSRAHTPVPLYASRVITATGQSFIYLCVVKLSHLLFKPRQFGALIGLSMAFGFCGGILGTMPAQRIAAAAGWRPLFLTVGACCLVAALATTVVLSRLTEKSRKSSSVTWRTVLNLFNEPGRFCFVTFDFWSYPAFFVIQAILGQKFIQDYLGYGATAAASFTMAMTLMSIVTCLVGAPLLHFIGERRKPLLIFSKATPMVSSFMMLLGVYLQFPGWVFLACFMLLSFSQLSSAASSALMSEITDTKTIAFSAAVRNLFPYVGAGLVGGICGKILDGFSKTPDASGVIHYPPQAYEHVLFTIGMFALIGVLMALRVPETRGKHIFSDELRAGS